MFPYIWRQQYHQFRKKTLNISLPSKDHCTFCNENRELRENSKLKGVRDKQQTKEREREREREAIKFYKKPTDNMKNNKKT